jgi:K+/H+ antiporter YhaU regulatory subunit KhtT
MTTPNTKFNLTVRDIEMIEHALRDRQRTVIEYKLTATNIENQQLADQEIKEIQDLLGRLHDQKNFYRPKNKIYVGG